MRVHAAHSSIRAHAIGPNFGNLLLTNEVPVNFQEHPRGVRHIE